MKKLFSVIALIALTSCSMGFTNESKVDLSKEKQLIIGKSKKADVEKLFGTDYKTKLDFVNTPSGYDGKKLMVYDAGTTMDSNPIPFTGGTWLYISRLIITLDNFDTVQEHKVLHEKARMTPY